MFHCQYISAVLCCLFVFVVIASTRNFLLNFIMVVVLICFQLTVVSKLVEKLLVPKQSESSPVERQSASQGVKWSFAAGTNLLSKLGAKIERESKLKLNEFSRELKSFRSVDMSGMLAGLVYESDVDGLSDMLLIQYAASTLCIR